MYKIRGNSRLKKSCYSDDTILHFGNYSTLMILQDNSHRTWSVSIKTYIFIFTCISWIEILPTLYFISLEILFPRFNWKTKTGQKEGVTNARLYVRKKGGGIQVRIIYYSAKWGLGGLKIRKNVYVINGRTLT